MKQLPIGTLTLLFTDIEGSTRLLRQLGSRYADLLRECRRLLRTSFQQWSGYEVDTQGDAFFVVFESAEDAVSAAVTAQQAIFAASWPDGVGVRVRMGMHTGEPQPAEEGYIGMDVHQAARIMSAAHGGQVLLSQTTRDLIVAGQPDAFQLLDLGEYRLKDIAGLNRLFQLLIQGLPVTFPPLATLNSQRPLRNIPSPTASFVGREQEISTICTQLRRTEVRLLTLIGAAGVGKTRLALRVITELTDLFVDSICFVPLEQLKDNVGVVAAIAQALAIQEGKSSVLIEQVKSTLREQSVLLVLDNFEQVLPARLLISELLASCPTLKILVTSRIILHLQAERLFELHPLPLPTPEQETDPEALLHCSAIALFIQRVNAVMPDFALTEANRADIVEICKRLDGMPLAIELAAAQSRHFSPSALLAHLEKGMIVLQGKAQDVPERQRTLRGAIAWSYDLLESDEQAVFRRLTVCAGTITLEAAKLICTAVGQISRQVSEVLEELVDKSMLQRDDRGTDAGYFWLLRVLRQYGAERLTAAGELAATRTAQSEYYLSWVEHVVPLLSGAELVHGLDQLDHEYENVRIALEWLLDNSNTSTERAEQALRLCVALMRFWEIRGYTHEGLIVLKRALRVEQNVSAVIKAQALHHAGFLALMQDDNMQAESFLRESQLLFRESGDKRAMANILRLQGILARVKNNYKVARRLLEEAHTLYQEYNDLQKISSAQNELAQIAIAQCNYTEAISLLEEVLASYKASGEQYSTAYPLFHMARALFLSQIDPIKAHTLAEQTLTLFRATGNRRLAGYTLDLLGQILSMEQTNEASAMLKEGLEIFKSLNERFGIAEASLALAEIAASRDDHKAAQAFYQQSSKLLKELGERESAATFLESHGNYLAAQGDARQAVRLWGAAAATRSAIVAPMPPVYRHAYRQAIASARQYLNEDDFRTHWLEGSKTPLNQLM